MRNFWTTEIDRLAAKYAGMRHGRGVWTTPRTWSSGELVTALMMNTHIRDNLNVLKTSINDDGTLKVTSLSQVFRGLMLQTHPDNTLAPNQVSLMALSEVTMNDGANYKPTSATLPLTADITASGAAGLDTGSRVASTWYEIHLIGKSATLALTDLRLLLHRAKNYLVDQSLTVNNGSRALRLATSTATDLIAQGFKTTNTGLVEATDVLISRAGAVSGNMWLEIHADNAGNPAASALAVSDKMDASVLNTNTHWVKFVFRTPVSLTSGTQYHLVLNGDYTRSDTVNVVWYGDTVAGDYANGVSKDFNGTVWSATPTSVLRDFKIYVTQNDTALTFPAGGYNQSCKLGYVYNKSGNVLSQFKAIDRVNHSLEALTGLLTQAPNFNVPGFVDLSAVIPPGFVKIRASTKHDQPSQSTFIAPVPEGYKLPTAPGALQRIGGTMEAYDDTSSANVGHVRYLDVMHTSYQTVYLTATGGGAASVVVSSFEW